MFGFKEMTQIPILADDNTKRCNDSGDGEDGIIMTIYTCDRPATGCNRPATGCDRQAIGCDRQPTSCDRQATGCDRQATGCNQSRFMYRRA